MFWMDYVTVRETEAGLRYTNGRFEGTVGPGRHRVRRLPWLREELVRVDLRRTELAIQGQEMLTADGLSVRLNVVAEYRVADAARAAHAVQSYHTALYTALQLLLREAVQSRTLDELLASRAALSADLLQPAQAQAAEIGLELVRVGVKDVILSGEVKKMLSQEIEAQRAGRAALVAAREEVAATRARSNTARLLQDHPMLVRLREIEALAQVAGGHGNTVVIAVPTEVMGAATSALARAPKPSE
jgi:regulator of protease activity HflC (stomatin/prohibitin superfamily)